jgi:N-methylhydantoinase A
MNNGFRVGVDIGGTFTDIIFIGDDGSVFSKKTLSTPDDYSRGIIIGIQEVIEEHYLRVSDIKGVVHATTIVTNACIELKGAKVGLITTKGFRDILEIGRGRMPVVYDLTWRKPTPLVPRFLRLEVDERINAKGEVIHTLETDEAEKAIDKITSQGVEAIAVCLFNSPKNPVHEQKLEQLINKKAPKIHTSISTKVTPMLKEYERTSETVVNAYVMPLVATYLKSLRGRLTEAGVQAPLYIMQSSGGMITPEVALERPIEIIECGPAAGVVGCAYQGKIHNIKNLITFDMGGTTAKASIVEDGHFTRSMEYEVGGGVHRASRLLKGKGYVIRVPSIDIAEVGAGGGSILWMDVGGALHIGPLSAGAMPGPACYDLGGVEPTLTDVCLILGYQNQDYLLGGELKLNSDRAFKIFEDKVAKPLGMETIEAAYGAYCLANANMMRVIRAISSERGRDPRKFVLYAFGGSGPVHAVGVSQGLGIRTIIVPPFPGVFSALGLLCADFERHYVQAFSHAWEDLVFETLRDTVEGMINEAISSAKVWAKSVNAKPYVRRYVELRYEGQSSVLSVPIPEGKLDQNQIAALADAFETEHEKIYGYRLTGYPLWVDNVRIVVTIPTKKHMTLPSASSAHARLTTKRVPGMRKAYFGKKYGFLDTPVLGWEQIGRNPVEGPILIDCYDTTIVVPPFCTIATGDWGNIIINIAGEEA